MDERENTLFKFVSLAARENTVPLIHEEYKIFCVCKARSLIHHVALKFLHRFQKLAEMDLCVKYSYLRALFLTNNYVIFAVVVTYIHTHLQAVFLVFLFLQVSKLNKFIPYKGSSQHVCFLMKLFIKSTLP
jgi:hypothetical protein